MKTRRPVIGVLLLAIFQWMFLAGTCRAQGVIDRDGSIEGFGKLTWGISAEQAEKIYHDLQFRGYEIGKGKEEPARIYSRNAGPETIDGVPFDSLEYGFKGDRLYLVRASLRSKIGPRTLVTRAEASWGQMVDHLARKYGPPKERRTDYVTEYLVAVKGLRWETGGVFIRLNYRGPQAEEEDQLIFEMEKRPGGRP